MRELELPGAAWVWDSSSGLERDYWLRFRGRLDLPSLAAGAIASAELAIAADARYALWVNGTRVGRGPGRHWPEAVPADRYEVARLLRPGANAVAVLVSSPGTSTSQYIARRGALVLSLKAAGPGWEARLDTGCGWRASRQAARAPNAPRINVSQPYAERFDARLEEPDWREAGFDDSAWEAAGVVWAPGLPGSPPWGLAEPDYPALGDDERHPVRVARARFVRAGGFSARVDYKAAFYPGDLGTTDKLQSGCVATIVRCPSGGPGRLVLGDRKWPAEDERFSLNGTPYAVGPGEEGADIELRPGDNLLVLDLSGAYQRFSADFALSAPPGSSLEPPDPGLGSPFVAIGPFLGLDIGNIVCAEGFDAGPEAEGRARAMAAADRAGLAGLPIVPIPPGCVESPSVKALLVGAREAGRIAPGAGLMRLCVPGGGPAEIPLADGLDTELLVDFGAEVSGFLELELEASEGTVVDALFFERLASDEPEVPTDLDNTMRYIAREGRQSHYCEIRRGFRYALVAVRGSSRCAIERMTLHQSLYPAPEDDGFDCSDPQLVRIAELCRRTARLCMEDAFVDCPGFEQAYWIGDARNCALVDDAAFGSYGLSRRCLLLAAGSLSRSSVPECHVPAGVSLTLTAWSLLWLLACGEHWDETADRGFLEEIYPAVSATVDAFLGTRAGSGLIAPAAWNMFDWAGMDTPYRGVVAHQNATFARCLGVASALALALGRRAEAERFRAEAEASAAAFDAAFWDEAEGAYRDCIRADGSPSPVFSVQTNLLALLSGCVPAARRPSVELFVDRPPETAVKVGSPFASFFAHERLAAQGRLAELFDDVRRRWGEMLDYGAATAWETFLGFYEGRLTRSYCHGWSTGPLYFLLRYALGVRRDREAEARGAGRYPLLVAPACDLFSRCSGRVHTPSGPVDIAWRLSGGDLLVEGSIPAGLPYRISPPPGFQGRVESRIARPEGGRA